MNHTHNNKNYTIPESFILRLGRLKHSYLLVALASAIWLLLRSVTKPSRLAYPCQRIALYNVIGSFGLIFVLLRKKIFSLVRSFFASGQKIKSALIIGAVIISSLGIIYFADQYSKEQAWTNYWKRAQASPIGKSLANLGKASPLLFQTIPSALALSSPHRVVSMHSSQATSWVGSGNPLSYMNQNEINTMVQKGVMELTGELTSQGAWQKIIPYQPGESVAIKLNFNNLWSCSGFTSNPSMNAYPALVNAVIDGLKSIGVPSEKIWITDPSRPVNDAFRAGITDQQVLYYTKCSNQAIGGRPNVLHTGYVSDGSVYSTQADRGDGVLEWINPAEVFVNTSHIINIPQLKGHGGASITLGIKNHFGSVDFTEFAGGSSPLHTYIYSGTAYPGKNLLVDISDNPVFRDKTRLIIGDGLMGHPTSNYSDPVLWKAFKDNPPEILFFGADPVAVDSVMFDYLQLESALRGYSPRNDTILSIAATKGLGVFEHWNNDTEKKYSSIDYIKVDFDTQPSADTTPPAAPTGVSVS